MAELKTYQVEVNGSTAFLRLSDADAKARGLLKPAADKPAAAAAADKPETKESAAPRNKSRAASANK